MKNTAPLNSILASIANIIFDLGGVITNISYMRTQHAFEALGLTSFGQLYSQAAQTKLFDLYEKGLISTETFRERFRLLAPHLKLSNDELDSAWNAMILDTPAHRLAILSKAKACFSTFLLSNTNELHIQYLNNRLKAEHGIENLNGYFTKVYYSHQVQLRKPDREIFEHVLRQNNLSANRTLFIYDTIRHIESAKALGIQCLHIGTDITLDELYAGLLSYCTAQNIDIPV